MQHAMKGNTKAAQNVPNETPAEVQAIEASPAGPQLGKLGTTKCKDEPKEDDDLPSFEDDVIVEDTNQIPEATPALKAVGVYTGEGPPLKSKLTPKKK